jgi:hypothetical protein
MGTARAKDKLRSLARAGLIREELVRAWETTRNAAAHGAGVDPEKIERAYRAFQATQALFNELVFLIIGYTGQYTDYSGVGWQIRNFDKTLTRE